MPVGTFRPLQGRVVPRARGSIAALHKLTEQGYTYVQTHRAAGLVRGQTVIECPPEGHMFRVPTGGTVSGQAAEMRLAEYRFKRFAHARARRQQLPRFEAMHKPRCLTCPDDACDIGNIKRKPAVRKVQGSMATSAEKGLVLNIDYVVGMPESAAGNTGAMNVSEATHNLGYLVPTKGRDGPEALQAFQKCVQQIFRRLPVGKRHITRVHSDQEKSILGGELRNYIQQKGWWQTTTS
jgi:hypothetical protein